MCEYGKFTLCGDSFSGNSGTQREMYVAGAWPCLHLFPRGMEKSVMRWEALPHMYLLGLDVIFVTLSPSEITCTLAQLPDSLWLDSVLHSHSQLSSALNIFRCRHCYQVSNL